MIWILIIISNMHVTVAEFYDKQYCEAARSAINQVASVRSVCVNSGREK